MPIISSGTSCSVSRRSILRTTIAALAAPPIFVAAASGEPDLSFHEAADGGFTFDTGVLRGRLRAGGKSGGLSDVVHVPSGARISQTYGLAGHYRVLAANCRFMPDVWAAPSQATLAASGSVVARWPAAADRPFEMRITYRWCAPDALEVETSVTARAPLAGFESFLASYFAEEFSRASVLVREGEGTFVAADEAGGSWQMFPRDAAAVGLIKDGRWSFPPNPVDWRIRTDLKLPIAIRSGSASGLSAAAMARGGDCFAVSTPVQNDGHRSLYLSLFGRNLTRDETASARAWLMIGVFQDKEVVGRYRNFDIASMSHRPTRTR